MIPEAAVEAAAEAAYNATHKMQWWQLSTGYKRELLPPARAALEAAAPHMLAQALRDAVDAFPLETITAPDNAVVWLMRRAEQIRNEA